MLRLCTAADRPNAAHQYRMPSGLSRADNLPEVVPGTVVHSCCLVDKNRGIILFSLDTILMNI